MCNYIISAIVITYYVMTLKCDDLDCHDDPEFETYDEPHRLLRYTWLGALQYIHIQKGNPHYFRVPRVVLVSRQFVLATAFDAAVIPPGYALGNVAFGDYERDPAECQITQQMLNENKVQCDPVILLMPIADVLLHPEYKNFDVKHSVALLKLIRKVRSSFMLPICLPNINFFSEDGEHLLRHIDFVSDAPRDFVEEEKEMKLLSLEETELCYPEKSKETRKKGLNVTVAERRTVCTTGCGFRSGAPTAVHELTGHWTLIALAIGGTPCPDPLHEAPAKYQYHIQIFPYVPWITTALTGKIVSGSAKNDPFGYAPQMVRRGKTKKSSKSTASWWFVGHTWLAGIRCFDRGSMAKDLYRFYYEHLQIEFHEDITTPIFIHLEVDAPKTTRVECVKIILPLFARIQPTIWGLHTSTIKLSFTVTMRNNIQVMQVGCWGRNITAKKKPDITVSTTEGPNLNPNPPPNFLRLED